MNVTFPVVKRKFLHSFPRIHTLFALTSVLKHTIFYYILEEMKKKNKKKDKTNINSLNINNVACAIIL